MKTKLFVVSFLFLIVFIGTAVFLNRSFIESEFKNFTSNKSNTALRKENFKIELVPKEPINYSIIETDFVEFDLTNIPKVSELESEEFDYQEDCGNGATDNFRRELASMSTKSFDSISDFSVYRLDNPESNLGKNTVYDDSYQFIDNVLKATPDYTDVDIRSNALQNIIYRHCSGDFQRVFYIREVDTSNYSSVKLIYVYGSTQSIVDSAVFFPFSMYLIARDESNTLYIAEFINLELFDFLTENTLKKCKDSSNGSNNINIFENVTHKCVIEEFNLHKDTELLNRFEKALISRL